jgi:hypothetical protein
MSLPGTGFKKSLLVTVFGVTSVALVCAPVTFDAANLSFDTSIALAKGGGGGGTGGGDGSGGGGGDGTGGGAGSF